ncbi:MAG: MotA/TolQ/ExbB proton channel family protein [Phycisphaerales bacterium]|nr:MotA/TolQ/ExbB proton channel family protein [Phycisphaerales bacterium]
MSQMLLTAVLAQADPPSAGLVATVWDMVLKGGWAMIPLGACSLVAMTLVVERFIMTRPGRVAPAGLLAGLLSMRATPRQALARCDAERAPLAAVLAAAIKSRSEPREIRERHIAEAGERQVRKLRHRMRLLSCLPQAATMLGLLGTVFGMIRTFTVVAASAESLGKTEKLAQGIYEAWTATAAGLVIAIPTLLMFHIIMGRIDSAAASLDLAAATWLERETEPVTIETAPVAVSRAAVGSEPELAIANG